MSVLRNGRGVGITEWLHGATDAWTIVLAGLVTQLGDVWFLFLLGGTLYVAGDSLPRWRVDRRRGAFVFGLVLAYLSLVIVLKTAFSLPRPPGAGEVAVIGGVPATLEALIANIATGEGYGFPSGHALGSTMVWGGVALVLRKEMGWVRYGIAGTVVALVSLSRLVLGVHYAVDVVAGVAAGVAALFAFYWLTDRATEPERLFFAAAAVGIAGTVLEGSFDSVATAGGAVGAWIAWRAVAGPTSESRRTGREVGVSVAVLALSGALFSVVYAVRPSAPVTFLGSALAAAGVVGAPLLSERAVTPAPSSESR